MEICKCSSPASFSFLMRSGTSRYPLVIMPAMMPCLRMRAMTSSISGCISGSPPEITMTVVPSSASLSTLRYISSSGTGFEWSSYSLQYAHARLQRRIGMICACTTWSVETSPFTIIFASRRRRCIAIMERRRDISQECNQYYKKAAAISRRLGTLEATGLVSENFFLLFFFFRRSGVHQLAERNEAHAFLFFLAQDVLAIELCH